MSKRTITGLFIGAALAFMTGIVVGLIAVVVAIANGAVSFGGANVVSVDGDALAGMVVWLVIASLLIGGGTVVAIASWVAALFNTVKLDDKTWFILLLVLGLASFGWVAMIAYVLAGPDGTHYESTATGASSAAPGGPTPLAG
jgi:hypothetical protein